MEGSRSAQPFPAAAEAVSEAASAGAPVYAGRSDAAAGFDAAAGLNAGAAPGVAAALDFAGQRAEALDRLGADLLRCGDRLEELSRGLAAAAVGWESPAGRSYEFRVLEQWHAALRAGAAINGTAALLLAHAAAVRTLACGGGPPYGNVAG